jgi:hypothetical protein
MTQLWKADPLVEEHVIEITCSGCDHLIDRKVKEIRGKVDMACPRCEHTIVLGTSRLNAQIRSIESSIGKVRDQLSKAGTFDSVATQWKKAPPGSRKPPR